MLLGDGAGQADYRRYYTDETADLVARYFATDIARFDYAFDDPANPCRP